MRILWGGSRWRTSTELKKWWGEGVSREQEFLQCVYIFTVYSVLGYRLKICTNTVFLAPLLVKQFVRAVCWKYAIFFRSFSLKKLFAHIDMDITCQHLNVPNLLPPKYKAPRICLFIWGRETLEIFLWWFWFSILHILRRPTWKHCLFSFTGWGPLLFWVSSVDDFSPLQGHKSRLSSFQAL